VSDRLTLALDGSTRVCSAALLRAAAGKDDTRWDVLATRSDPDGRGQSRVLLRLVDEMLDELGAEPGDLGEIVVGIGPGTFTGARIAVATGRGLAVALSIPVFGVSTLSALASGALSQTSEQERASWSSVVPAIDARRQQVFYALYEAPDTPGDHGVGTWTRRRLIAACDKGAFAESLSTDDVRNALVIAEDQTLVGELPPGVGLYESEVRAEYLVAGQEWLRDCVGIGGVGAESESGEGQPALGTPETVKPIYVRAPDADIHITKMKDPWGDGRDRR
jgi:tRNA threonylcarbamoyl adenosine modification protein YeaZ